MILKVVCIKNSLWATFKFQPVSPMPPNLHVPLCPHHVIQW